MQSDLCPRERLEELFESTYTSRQRDESVRQFVHQRLAFMHRFDDTQIKRTSVMYLAVHEVYGDNAYNRSPVGNHGICQDAHQTNAAASIYQSDTAPNQFAPEQVCGVGILWVCSI